QPARGRADTAGPSACTQPPPPPRAVRVPRRFVDLARETAPHPDPRRWQLLYTVLWRLLHEAPDLLERPADPDVRALVALQAEARRAKPALDEPPPTGATPFV